MFCCCLLTLLRLGGWYRVVGRGGAAVYQQQEVFGEVVFMHIFLYISYFFSYRLSCLLAILVYSYFARLCCFFAVFGLELAGPAVFFPLFSPVRLPGFRAVPWRFHFRVIKIYYDGTAANRMLN